MSSPFCIPLMPIDLEQAYAEDRFELHYQPQVSSRDGTLVGVEALVRLRERDGTLIAPSAFIPQVEESDLVHRLGLRLFERACVQAGQWSSLVMAVNVSPVQFRDLDLSCKLNRIASDAGIDPRRLEIEITEGLFFDDPDRAGVALKTLHDAGFGVALDDFGTGYSSLGYLLRFPVSKLKIDRSFVMALPDDAKSASIIHALTALARSLGLKVVAEGVETEPQRVFLRAAGCHILQGYLFGAPMPAAAIAALL